MKLRILGNSIRLRLKQSEVERIGMGQAVEQATSFPSGPLVYRLQVGNVDALSADWVEGRIELTLPRDAAKQWAGSDQISLTGEQATDSGEPLSLLVEKDFKCLSPGHHRSREEDEDTFPHPEAETGRGC